MTINIRPAVVEDAAAIARFQIDMAMETEEKVLQPEVVEPAVQAVFADAAGSKGFYLVAEAGGVVVGSLLITFEWSDWRNSNMWYIQSVYVQPDFRGQGIFRSMFESVVELARTQSVTYVRLYVETENERAQKTYEALGMKRMPYYMYDIKV